MDTDNTDDRSALERARERLYAPDGGATQAHEHLAPPGARSTQHAWASDPPPLVQHRGRKHVRFAALFVGGAFLFFLISSGIAAYVLYYGGNSVSVNKITIATQGPTTIAGGDIVPLSLSITNRNPVALENVTLEIAFPDGTRSADNVLTPYPRYTENIGTIPSGATILRSVKAIIFGASGAALSLPISLSYEASGSNAVFVKKTAYALGVSSTPLSVSVDSLTETVSGKPFAFMLTVRSNATVPIDNVTLAAALPFGFAVASSSVPFSNSTFFLGTLQPGESRTVTLTGSLSGQDQEQRAFHFTVGTAKSESDHALGVAYMTQDANVTITAPFIRTNLALNGDTSNSTVVSPGATQTGLLSYSNALGTSVTNATIRVTLSGAAVDYSSIQSQNGFYDSTTHSIVFSQDTDPSLASLAPGASGVGSFTFRTVSAEQAPASPTITFTTSVSGTRIGQANVPELVTASATRTAKMSTSIALTAQALHAGGSIANTGPVPPRVGLATTYTVVWNARDNGNALAGSVMTATLPSYVAYTNKTAGSGTVSYDQSSRQVTWDVGDIPQGGVAEASFQVSLTPSSSQRGTAPALTSAATFTGHDRFAGIDVTQTVGPATTETVGDPGYVADYGRVQ